MLVLGVDFTCAPRRAKPITVAHGALDGESLVIEHIERIETFAGFEALLRAPGPWVGGFDFPFGLPRELVVALGWPTVWCELIRHFATLDRSAIARTFDAFRAGRPVGRKYAHRAGDAASLAHSSMKLVNPPVARMLHAGAPRLLDAGVHVPALHAGDRSRVALEAYPGLLMRMIAEHCRLGRAPSYKNDVRAKQTVTRRDARAVLLQALRHGEHRLRIRARIRDSVAREAVEDGSGDALDAIAAAVQAAWGALRCDAGFGLPPHVDRLEGWIVSA